MSVEPPNPAVSALRRLAFLHERAGAEPYKVKAYRAAAVTLEALDDSTIRQMTQAGTLTSLSGVGQTIAGVVSEVIHGGEPEKLTLAEADYRQSLPEFGAALRAQLRGDLHTHTDWSDGTTSLEEMIRAAGEVGHSYLAITDHSPNLKIAKGLSALRLQRQADEIARLREVGGGVDLIHGIEVDILKDGSLDHGDDVLAGLDLRVASVHSDLRAEGTQMTKRMLRAIAHPLTNVLGHCTGRLVGGSRGLRPQSEFDAAEIFAACAEYDVAVEINCKQERIDPPDDLLALAIEAGCLFSIDSDAHAPGHLDRLIDGADRAERAGIDCDRIVNTWSHSRVLGWAASKV